jgi:mono/diheme cytochrome c family protein
MLWGATSASAQQASHDSTRSTLMGVFTDQQAARGRDLYAASCTGCHTAASHTGVAFWNTWVGRPLSELFNYVSERMPKSDPGSLTREEYAQLVAHLLKLNGMPVGDEELPPDSVALKRILIESAKKDP